MKNTEMLFLLLNNLDIYRYLSLHIRGNGDSVEVFRLFSMYLNDKAFKYLKNKSKLFW